jgi:hypothetical protein
MNLLIPSRQLLAHALWAAVSASLCAGVQAQGADTVEVRAERESMSGLARSASEGIVSGERLRALPLLRPGEVLEMVPGLMVTQHAGDGKANQYFLRGFNLDHGTDFATFVGGMPVNMPSHAHGQGYTDLNFLIPGLVQKVHYQKGPYDAQNGDFGSAGTAHIDYLRQMDSPLAQVTLGQGGFARSLLAGSPSVGSGKLLYGLEVFRNDGPWQTPEDYRKLNGVLRYSEGSTVNGYAVSAMAYRGRWTSTDQVPQRAIDRGLISLWQPGQHNGRPHPALQPVGRMGLVAGRHSHPRQCLVAAVLARFVVQLSVLPERPGDQLPHRRPVHAA